MNTLPNTAQQRISVEPGSSAPFHNTVELRDYLQNDHRFFSILTGLELKAHTLQPTGTDSCDLRAKTTDGRTVQIYTQEGRSDQETFGRILADAFHNTADIAIWLAEHFNTTDRCLLQDCNAPNDFFSTTFLPIEMRSERINKTECELHFQSVEENVAYLLDENLKNGN